LKYLIILGSTGSIGRNVINIVERFPQELSVKVLAARANVMLLARQIERFRPELAVVFDEKRARELKDVLASGIDVEILYGEDGYRTAAAFESADMCVTAMVGAAGLGPLRGRRVFLAGGSSTRVIPAGGRQTGLVPGGRRGEHHRPKAHGDQAV
jgi:1-deoxy-D-xylulose-5-phosphate reductoisomerase